MAKVFESQVQPSWIERRLAPRHPATFARTARVGERDLDLTVRDISHTGFLARTPERLHLGDQVEIDLPEIGRRSAVVVWAKDDSAGFSFDSAISRAALSASRLKADVANLREDAFAFDVQEVPEDYPKWPLRTRVAVIAVLGALAWAPFIAIGAWLLA